MSADLFQQESDELVSRMRGVSRPEAGVWDGFLRGTGTYFMRGAAQTASAIDMLGSIGPIVQDAFTGGTEAKDKYFREHDEVFGRAVEYWTPKPDEVGVAGQVVGQVLSAIPTLVASPSLFIATQQMAAAEELAKQGVAPAKSVAASTVLGASNALGIYVPILGRTLTQRALIGGAGFNVAQGIATRGVVGPILDGTPAEGQFQAFSGKDITIDALMGVAFGALAHITAPRVAAAKDELAVMRQAQHASADSLPGKLIDPLVDGEAHSVRLNTALDQLLRDEIVSVGDLPPARVEPDPARDAARQAQFEHMQSAAEEIRRQEGLPRVPDIARQEVTSSSDALGQNWNVEAVAIKEGEKPLYFKISDDSGRELAHADFIEENGRLMSESTHVDESLRGRGIAEMLYRAASEKYGMGIVPGREQTQAGNDFVRAMQAKGVVGGPELPRMPRLESSLMIEGRPVNRMELSGSESALEAFFSNRATGGVPLAKAKEQATQWLRSSQWASDPKEMAKGELFISKVQQPKLPSKKTVLPETEDPLSAQAIRIAADRPDITVHVGTDAEGKPITQRLADFLAEEQRIAKAATDDVPLLQIAAECLLGVR